MPSSRRSPPAAYRLCPPRWALGAVLLLFGGSAPANAGSVCETWSEPMLLAEVDSPEINESSGLAASRHRPGVWFTHNDAGGSAELYAFTEGGEHVETHAVQGAAFRDWEALGDGPCPQDIDAEHCLYVGDVGDNGRSRADVFVYVVPEPLPGEDAVVEALWRLGWPDGAEDSEALVVHPCTGRVYLITKHNGGRDASVWRLPSSPILDVDPAPLEWVATLPQPWLGGSGQVTGADWSDGGDQLVLRTYSGAWLWETDPEDPDAHWSTAPSEVPLDTAGQGESIAFQAAGGILATAEGVPMRVVVTPCATAVDAAVCPDPDPDPDTDTDTGDTASADTGTAQADDTAPGGNAAPSTALDSENAGCGCGGGQGRLLWLALLPLGLHHRRRRASSHGGPRSAGKTRSSQR